MKAIDDLVNAAAELKKASFLEKSAKAQPVLDAAIDLLIEQQNEIRGLAGIQTKAMEEISNLSNAVNFLQKTMENQANELPR